MIPELHRPVALEQIGPTGHRVTVEANPTECRAVASRLAIPAVANLSCDFTLRSSPEGLVEASGELRACVTRTCVLSLDDFETDVTERFALHFVPAGTESDDPDPDSPDESPYAGDAIDLGEATTEQLALALDPYPRAPDAALPEQAAEEDASLNPFAALAALRRTLD